MKPGEIKILTALTTGESLTFKELKEKTELSNTALANYLNLLLQTGVVRKDFKDRKYLLASIYLPMKNFANEWQKQMKVAAVSFLKIGGEISKIKDKEQRITAMKTFLKASFHLLTLYIWQVIGESISDFVEDPKPKKLDNQDLVLKKSAIIVEAIQNWVTGIADAIATSLILNINIINEADESVYREMLRETEKHIEKLEALRETWKSQ